MSWTNLPYQVENFYYNRTYQVYTKVYEAVTAAAVEKAATIALSIRDMYRMRGSRRGGGGVRGADPPESLKNIGFHSNIGPDPLKITKLPNHHSMLSHHRHASETPKMAFRWRADDGPLIVVFGSSFLSSTEKKTLSKLDPL